jgi:hypothetical protein
MHGPTMKILPVKMLGLGPDSLRSQVLLRNCIDRHQLRTTRFVSTMKNIHLK